MEEVYVIVMIRSVIFAGGDTVSKLDVFLTSFQTCSKAVRKTYI